MRLLGEQASSVLLKRVYLSFKVRLTPTAMLFSRRSNFRSDPPERVQVITWLEMVDPWDGVRAIGNRENQLPVASERIYFGINRI